jgi:hypothetical protein
MAAANFTSDRTMEANQIAPTILELKERCAALRRYL